MKRFIEAGIVAASIGILSACGNGDNSIPSENTVPSSEVPACPNFKSDFYPYTMECPEEWVTDWVFDQIITNTYHDLFFLKPPETGRFVPQIDIWAKNFNSPLSLDEFSENEVKKMEDAGYTNIKFPINDISIDGRPTLAIRSTDAFGFESWRFLFINGETQGWSAEFSSIPSEFKNYSQSAHDSISNIDIVE